MRMNDKSRASKRNLARLQFSQHNHPSDSTITFASECKSTSASLLRQRHSSIRAAPPCLIAEARMTMTMTMTDTLDNEQHEMLPPRRGKRSILTQYETGYTMHDARCRICSSARQDDHSAEELHWHRADPKVQHMHLPQHKQAFSAQTALRNDTTRWS